MKTTKPEATNFQPDRNEVPKRKPEEKDGPAAKKKSVSKMLDNDELKIKELIGEGGMAKVFKGTWREMDVAIKKHESSTKKQAIQMAKSMEAEIDIQQNLSYRCSVTQKRGRRFYLFPN